MRWKAGMSRLSALSRSEVRAPATVVSHFCKPYTASQDMLRKTDDGAHTITGMLTICQKVFHPFCANSSCEQDRQVQHGRHLARCSTSVSTMISVF